MKTALRSLQIPHQVEGELQEFKFKGKTYKIVGESIHRDLIPQALPMGVIMSGFTKQYIAEDDKGEQFEVYVYYYRRVEGDRMAIVDGMRVREVSN